jgi:hypothetical protein
MRYPNESIPENKTEILNIAYFFKIKKMLDNLENEKISIYTKLQIVEEWNDFSNSSKYASNIFAGGLMKDW